MSDVALVIDVVDNVGQWTHREWRMLRYLGVDTQIVDNTTPVESLRELDGIILSGGAARVGLTGELGNCGAYLELDMPILGICAGHQFMASFYGGEAAEAPAPEFGAANINLVNGGGKIFTGTPETQVVFNVCCAGETPKLPRCKNIFLQALKGCPKYFCSNGCRRRWHEFNKR